MRYYKNIENAYLMAVGTGDGGTEIGEEEYHALLRFLEERPEAPAGMEYRPTAALDWEIGELTEPKTEEATMQDMLNALERLGVNTNEEDEAE